MTERLNSPMPETPNPDQHIEPRLDNEDGPLTWYGITFPSQEAKDEALAELQAKLDRITEAEQAAWRDIKTNPTIY